MNINICSKKSHCDFHKEKKFNTFFLLVIFSRGKQICLEPSKWKISLGSQKKGLHSFYWPIFKLSLGLMLNIVVHLYVQCECALKSS